MNTPESSVPRPEGEPWTEPSEPPAIPDHELLRVIGRGRYGVVWLARSVTGAYRAVKVIYRGAFESERTFLREFEGIRKAEPLSRTHVSQLAILHVGPNPPADYYYCVMELADDVTTGQDIDPAAYAPRTLRGELKRRGRLPVNECIQITTALTEALGYLHAHNLAHRDIKPENIIFVHRIPKLADIGLVTGTQATVSWVGTPVYMPPEGPGKPPADIFSLGRTLYEISTGRPVSDYPELPAEFATLPDRDELLELNEVFGKACAHDPKKRYPSAEAMREDLRLLLAGRSVRQQQRLKRVARVAICTSATLVVLGVVGLLAWKWKAGVERRESLVRQAQVVRTGAHMSGWSSNAWNLVREASRQNPDPKLRSPAAAALVGWDAQLKQLRTNDDVASIALNHAATKLLISSPTSGVQVLDLLTGSSITNQIPGRGPGAFSQSGTPLQLSQDSTYKFSLWDVAGGRALAEFALDPEPLPGLLPEQTSSVAALSDDGSHVAIGYHFHVPPNHRGGRFAIWQTTPPKLLFERRQPVTALAFSPDGAFVAAGDDQGRVGVWSIASGAEFASYTPNPRGVRSLAFGRDPLIRRGETTPADPWLVASADSGVVITVWSLAESALRARLRGAEYGVQCLAFSPDGATLASAGRGAVRLWDIATERTILQLGGGDFHTGLALSADGRLLASGNSRIANMGAQVHLWELEPHRGIQSLRGLSSQNTKMQFSPDGQYVAALAQDWMVGVWAVATGHLLHLFEVRPGDFADNAALGFSADNRLFAFSAGTEACVWETLSGRLVKRVPLPPGITDWLGFHPSGKLLLFRAETRDGTVAPLKKYPPGLYPRVTRIRDLFGENPQQPLVENAYFDVAVQKACMTPDARFLIVEGLRGVEDPNPKRAYLGLDPITGEQLWTNECATSGSMNIQIDSAGRFALVQRDEEGPVVAVGPASGRPLAQPRYGGIQVPSAVAPALGYSLAVNTMPNFILERPSSPPEELVALGIDTPRGSSFPVFSHDGQKVVWGSTDGTVFVADLPEVNRRLQAIGLDW